MGDVDVSALRDVTLTLPEGELVVLLGPSGSGKSTLLKRATGALDISTGVVVLEAFARVNTELGTTTVVITHNAAIAAMADRVIRLADGAVASNEKHVGAKLAPRDLSW